MGDATLQEWKDLWLQLEKDKTLFVKCKTTLQDIKMMKMSDKRKREGIITSSFNPN